MASSEAKPRRAKLSGPASADPDARGNKGSKPVRGASKARWILPILALVIAVGYLGAAGWVFYQTVGQKPYQALLAQSKGKDINNPVEEKRPGRPNRQPGRPPGMPGVAPGGQPGNPPRQRPRPEGAADAKQEAARQEIRKQQAESEQKIITALAMTEAARNHKGPGLLALAGTGGNVKRVVFSPTEPLLAALTQQGLLIWDLTTGKVKHKLQEHDDSLECLAFSPDGKILVAAGTDQAVRIWDVGTGVPGPPLEGHPGGIHSLAFSPDGKWIAAGGNPDQGGGGKSSIQVWNVPTSARVSLPPYSKAWVEAMAFRPSSSQLTYLDGTMKGPVLVDIPSGRGGQRPYANLGFRCSHLAFSPDGSKLLLGEGARDNPTAQLAIVNLANGAVKPMPVIKGKLRAVAWSPDGNTVAFDGADALMLWDVNAAKPLCRFEEKPNDMDFSGLAFSPGGTMLATSDGHAVKLWVVANMLAAK
jgi:Tol biopolymer transport system component